MVLFIREIFRKFPLLLWRNIILVIFVGVVDVASIIAIAPLVDFMTNPDPKTYSDVSRKIFDIMSSFGISITIINLIVVFLLINIIRSSLAIWLKYAILKILYSFVKNIMMTTFKTFFDARWYFFSKNKQGTLLNTFNRELEVVGNSFSAIAQLIAEIIQFALYLVVPFYISWKIAGISLASSLLLVSPFFLLGKVSRRLGKFSTSTANRVMGIIIENFSAAKVILGFGNQSKAYANLGEAFDAHTEVVVKSQALSQAIPLLYFPLGIAVMTISVYAGKKLSLPLSEIGVILYALMKILPTIGNITQKKNALENFFPSYEQINYLKKQAESLKQSSGDLIFSGFKKEIVITNLTFAHPNHAPVLIDLNIHISKGQMIAIVGESGAGKSTLIDVIMGFNEPTKGSIHIDGNSLQKFEISSYRRRIGYVPQDSILFHMSIKDNLLWAKEDATDEEILSACKLANAHDFIRDFKREYDTIVGDRGVRLSGGQIQRIALARAVLRKPDILILDEATSSLDTHSERLIQNAVENISKDTTVIAIAHRLSSIINSDYIYVIEKGRVVEGGTYSELTRWDSGFKKMAELQGLTTDNHIPC